MKKLLLSILLGGFALLANAQSRSIDLKAVAIYSPDTIKQSQTINIQSTFQNMGTDTILPGDTVTVYFIIGNSVFPVFARSIQSTPRLPNDSFQVNFNTGTFGMSYPNDTTF